MKMTKAQRRLARKTMFPMLALVMMTLMMAVAGAGHSTRTHQTPTTAR